MEVVMSGVITNVLQPQQGVSQKSGQPWVSQEYVLCHEQGQFPRSVCFRVFGQEKIQQMNIRQGEQLTIHLNIDCRQGQKGFFNSIDCWKVERPQVQMGMPQQQVYAPQPAPMVQQPQPMPSQFPPQVNNQGMPMPQQGVAMPAQGGQLPFPPAQ